MLRRLIEWVRLRAFARRDADAVQLVISEAWEPATDLVFKYTDSDDVESSAGYAYVDLGPRSKP